MASYLDLPGSAGNYASTPDAPVLDITGDIDIQALIAMDDWTPGYNMVLIAKYGGAADQSYRFQLNTTGALAFYWTEDGTSDQGKNSTASVVASNGEKQWLRVTVDVNNGGGDADFKFFTGGDGDSPSWSQLGATVNLGATTSIFSGGQPLEVGAYGNGAGSLMLGNFYRALVKDGIGGTDVFDADFTAELPGTTSFAESSNGATVTIHQSGSPQAEIVEDPDNPWFSAAKSGSHLGLQLGL